MVNKVLIPETFVNDRYIGKIYGRFIEDTGVFNIFDEKMISSGIKCSELGEISETNKNDDKLLGVWDNDNLSFKYKGELFSVEKYGVIQNVFSRNTGILETDKMLDKTVIIIAHRMRTIANADKIVVLDISRNDKFDPGEIKNLFSKNGIHMFGQKTFNSYIENGKKIIYYCEEER